MKKRKRSRSRSRSRSHSPSHGRDRNYPSRDYQNNRGHWGYNRGYRRPYYPRGRGRGFFPRGRYQRGGNNYGYRNNNWQGYRDHQQPHDHHSSHSPRRGRSRSRTPRKRSGSRSRSRSFRSSSAHSSSSSRSSTPRRRSSKLASKDPKAKASPAEPRSGSRGSKEGLPSPRDAASNAQDRSKWKGLTDYEATTSPQGHPSSQNASAEAKPVSEHKSPVPAASGNSGTLWKSVDPSTQSPKSPPKPPGTSTGFGFFSKGDMKPGEKLAFSSALKKYMSEQGKKPERENGREGDQSSADAERETNSSKTGRGLFDLSSTYTTAKTTDKGLPFLDPEEEDFLKGRNSIEEETKMTVKAPLSVRDLAEERFGKWDDSDYLPPSKETSHREMQEDVEEELQHMEEELYHSRKQAKEEKASKKKEKKKNRISPSSPTIITKSLEGRTRALFPAGREESPPPRVSGKRDGDVNFTIKSFDENLDGMSGIMAKERRMSRDLLHQNKKDQEFRSIFQHIQSAELRRSPSELFAQHIVTIVHNIKAQHFRSSGMTLNERFAMYQRRAAEMEMMKPRKSPEIHRIIDVSPTAFKRHAHLFEDVEESSQKDQGKRQEADLRLDIERRKKYPAKERKTSVGSQGPSRERSLEKSSKHHKKSKKSKKKRERSPSSSSSSSSSHSYRGKEFPGEDMEHMEEGYGKPRMGHRDYNNPMDRGPRDYEGHMERGRGGYMRGRGGYDPTRGGFQPRVRGRGWGRGNYPGNNNMGNPPPTGGPVRPPEEEWDPEYTPKSRKYYLHDDRDGEKKWLDARGRGRGNTYSRGRGFVFRKGDNSPKWTHDMFQGSEEGALADDSADLNHKDEDKSGDASKL
uniref:Thyroid hormone receptor-associated protein 3 n=1 Tax=Denticeps clupeoides TaxID=299321 RepID=A0AAY4DRH1_9TELE